MDYEWDPQKAEANRRKHGVDFADAVLVLEDPLGLTISDREHGEDRLVTTGADAHGHLLVVVYTKRDDAYRIISARKATKRERKQYEQG